MLYILNSLILPLAPEYSGATVTLQRVTVEEARRLVQSAFVSAVGHEGTAQVLSNILGVPVPMNRVQVHLKEGDTALHFVLKTRLPEGKVLSKEELEQLGYELVLSKIISAA